MLIGVLALLFAIGEIVLASEDDSGRLSAEIYPFFFLSEGGGGGISY